MTAPVLQVEGLHKRVGPPPRDLFHGFNLLVPASGSVAVCGRSGAGKSTLLHILGGLDRDYQGQVVVEGQDLRGLNDQRLSALRLRTVGFVFQAFHLVEHLTVLGNVLLPARFADRRERQDAAPRARTLLAHVGLLDRAEDRPANLSGGERQRVAIARALLMRPRLLLADEPTGNLDQDTAGQVLNLFTALVRESGAALVVVTHDASVAARCDRQVILQSGAAS